MINRIILLLVICFGVFSGAKGAELPLEKLIINSPDAKWNWTSNSRLRAEVKEVLAHKCPSVTDKRITPESGDKRDYISIGPYWWPNDYTTNGLPYVRKDGLINPDSENDSDLERIKVIAKDVPILTAARLRFDDKSLGEEAARRIVYFFLDPKTGMNPNMNFAQGIPGICKGRGIGVIDTVYLVPQFIDAAIILNHVGDLSDDDFVRLQNWFSQYVDWLLTSPNGVAESKSLNNHGTAWSLQTIVYAQFSGREDVVKKLLSEVASLRVGPQVSPNGMLTFELNRTRSFHYATFQVEMLCILSKLGEKYGIDIWHYESSHGASVIKAIEWIIPYMTNSKPWEYEQNVPYELREAKNVLAYWDEFKNSNEYGKPMMKEPMLTIEQTIMAAWSAVFLKTYDARSHLLYECPLNLLPSPREVSLENAAKRSPGMDDGVINNSFMLLAALSTSKIEYSDKVNSTVSNMLAGIEFCVNAGTIGIATSVNPADNKSFYTYCNREEAQVVVYALRALNKSALVKTLGLESRAKLLLDDATRKMEKSIPCEKKLDDLSLHELVILQVASRLTYEETKGDNERANVIAQMKARADYAVKNLIKEEYIDELAKKTCDTLYAPYDVNVLVAQEYVRTLGERMLIQCLCPNYKIEGNRQFERCINAIDFTKPCWYPPTAAVWYYWLTKL